MRRDESTIVKLAGLLWTVALLAVLGRSLATPGKQSVYPIFARAGQNWRAGTDLYLLTDLDKVSCNAFRYSPLAAAALVPLSLLPDRLAEVVWRLLNAGVLLAAVAWWSQAGLPWRLTRWQTAVLYLLLLPLTVGNINNGQSNPLVLALLLLTVTAAARQRWNIAAVFTALACLLKIYPIALGLLLAVVYLRRFAGRLVLFLALGLALPFLLQTPEYVAAQYADWLSCLQLDDRHDWNAVQGYRDLSLLFRVWLTPLAPAVYQAIQLAAAAGAALLVVIARRSGWPRRRLLTGLLALAGIWMTLFGSATESATYLLLAPSLVWAVIEANMVDQPLSLRVVLLTSYSLFVIAQLAGWFPGGAGLIQALGPQPFAALLLLFAVLWTWGRRSQERIRMYRRIAPRAQSV